jgi:replicative DNA helicase
MKTTPSAHEAEVSVLACLLIDPKAIEHVEPAHFLAPQHRAIAEAARELHDAREPIDLVSLGARLTARGEMDLVGGYGGISSMAVSVVSAANVEHYEGLVAEAHRRQKIITATERAIATRLRIPPESSEGFIDSMPTRPTIARVFVTISLI